MKYWRWEVLCEYKGGSGEVGMFAQKVESSLVMSGLDTQVGIRFNAAAVPRLHPLLQHSVLSLLFTFGSRFGGCACH